MKRAAPDFSTVFDLFFLTFGIWTVHCNAFVLSGQSFDALMRGLPLPLALVVLAVLYRRRVLAREERAPVSRDADPFLDAAPSGGISPWGLTGAAAGVVVLYAATGSFLLWWLAALAIVLVALRCAPRLALPGEASPGYGSRAGPPRVAAPAERWWTAPLLLLLIAVACVLYVPNPNWESAFYLSMGVSVAEFPERAMLRGDWLHGEAGLPPLGVYYLAHSYELAVAAMARLTGADPIGLFYQVFPRVTVGMSVVAHALAVRQLGARGSSAVLGTILALVVWLSWGGAAGTLGRWTFAGITTGKGALVALGVPAVVYAAARERDEGNGLSLLLLACVLISAVGLSSSGIIVAPLAAASVLLSGLDGQRASLLRTARGFTPLLYVAILAVALAWQDAAGTGGFASQIGALDRPSLHGAEEGLRRILGFGSAGPRPYLALLSLLALATLPSASLRERRQRGLFVLAALLLVVNPFAPELLSGLAPNMWWRSHWSVPFPLLMGLVGALAARSAATVGGRRVALAGVCALTLVFVLTPHRWAASEKNLRLPGQEGRRFYEDRAYRAARVVGEHFGPEDLVWAPERVAMWLVVFEGHPRLVAVRRHYLKPIFGSAAPREAEVRGVLMTWMEGARTQPVEVGAEMRSRLLRAELARLGMTGVVFERGNAIHDQLAEVLRAEGFTELEATHDYNFWRRSRSSRP